MPISNPTFAAELGAGYFRTPGTLADFVPLATEVVIREHLQAFSKHMILLKKPNTIYGTVLKCSQKATEQDGIQPGDTVIYEEFMGGRWVFPHPGKSGGEDRVLIMRSEFCQVRVLDAPVDEAD